MYVKDMDMNGIHIVCSALKSLLNH